MKALKGLVQGSPEWLAVRAGHNCASEASAMMGCGRHMSRSELLAMKKFGVEKQAGYFLERLREKGHEAEATARALVEDMLGEDLYPLTATDDAGYLLASSDGLTMDRKRGFEHKLWNAELAAMIRANELSPMWYWQLEQQCVVFGCEEIVFVCSDGTRENFVSMNYAPVPGRAAALAAGWRQFDADLQGFELVVEPVKPAAAAIQALPTLAIRMTGQVIETNLADFRAAAMGFIENINTELVTDQHFADAERQVKFCADAEAEIERVKKRLLDSTASVAEVFSTLDMVHEALRGKRLNLNKQVESQKVSRRSEILNAGRDAFVEHLIGLAKRIGRSVVMNNEPDFAGAIKGKRTIKSLEDAVATELARAKIEANAIADRIDANLRGAPTLIGEYAFLFPDLKDLALKSEDDFVVQLGQRIMLHQRAEQDKATAAPAVPSALTQAPGVHRIATFTAGQRVGLAPAADREQRWTFDVIDEGAVPREYLTPNTAMIAEAISEGVVITGIKARLLEAA